MWGFPALKSGEGKTRANGQKNFTQESWKRFSPPVNDYRHVNHALVKNIRKEKTNLFF